MTKTTRNTANQPGTANTATKPRRPRRMAREAIDGTVEPPSEAKVPNEPKPRGGSKIAGVIALLQREGGATLAELIEATGWLPHTTRAALTGLRQKGHTIAKTSREGATVYRIEQTA